MRIESAAGEFAFDIEALRISGGDVVLTGKMGVWEAETKMDRKDVARLLRIALGSPAFWGYLAALPFHAVAGLLRGGTGR